MEHIPALNAAHALASCSSLRWNTEFRFNVQIPHFRSIFNHLIKNFDQKRNTITFTPYQTSQQPYAAQEDCRTRHNHGRENKGSSPESVYEKRICCHTHTRYSRGGRTQPGFAELLFPEKVQKLFGILAPILNDNSTTLEKKIELAANNHIGMLMENPDLPLFVMSEIRNNPERFAGKVQAVKLIQESHFVKQIKEKRPDINPLHFVISLLGMVLFPFIAKPVLQEAGNLSAKGFQSMMEERKALIPIWLKAHLKTR
jgi:hypothetical protein